MVEREPNKKERKMYTLKRLSMVILVVVATMALGAGCGKKAEVKVEEQAEAKVEEQAEAKADPHAGHNP